MFKFLLCILCPILRIAHVSKEAWLLSLENGPEKPRSEHEYNSPLPCLAVHVCCCWFSRFYSSHCSDLGLPSCSHVHVLIHIAMQVKGNFCRSPLLAVQQSSLHTAVSVLVICPTNSSSPSLTFSSCLAQPQGALFCFLFHALQYINSPGRNLGQSEGSPCLLTLPQICSLLRSSLSENSSENYCYFVWLPICLRRTGKLWPCHSIFSFFGKWS